MLKKLLLLINSAVMLLTFATPVIVRAAEAPVDSCEKKTFLGVRPWYNYLPYEKDTKTGKCSINYPKNASGEVDSSRVIILVALAMIDILMGFAGIIAFIFIIVSGFKFVLSQGDPGKEKAARESLQNAVIGLVIALVAIGVVNFVGNALKA